MQHESKPPRNCPKNEELLIQHVHSCSFMFIHVYSCLFIASFPALDLWPQELQHHLGAGHALAQPACLVSGELGSGYIPICFLNFVTSEANLWASTIIKHLATAMSHANEGQLATALEEDSAVRRLVRETGKLTQWKTPALVGVASTDAAALNHKVLTHVAAWWTPRVSMPQAIPIEQMRKEARA